MYNKKVAVLCNGPSRSAYDPDKEYAYRIGCNIPWTKVDCTVIIDPKMLDIIARDPSLIDCKIYFGKDSWDYAEKTSKKMFEDLSLGVVSYTERGRSSGNIACLKAIELGYKDIDIYGADAFTCNDITTNTHDKSYTRNFKEQDGMNMSADWRIDFIRMIEKNLDVSFNFIKGDSNVKEL
jgi:hypothetical protein